MINTLMQKTKEPDFVLLVGWQRLSCVEVNMNTRRATFLHVAVRVTTMKTVTVPCTLLGAAR
jgi:hypothetical protein